MDGFADLQLGFRLGLPTHPHILPQHVHPLHPVPEAPAKVQPKKRKKGPARREKDRARAARHQARFQSEAAAVSSLPEEQPRPPVILHITGKLMPLISSLNSSVTAPVSTRPPPAPASTLPPGAPRPATHPTKTAAIQRYFYNKCVNRHLFPSFPLNPDQKMETPYTKS